MSTLFRRRNEFPVNQHDVKNLATPRRRRGIYVVKQEQCQTTVYNRFHDMGRGKDAQESGDKENTGVLAGYPSM